MNLQWLSPVDLQEQDGRSSSYAVDTQDARSDLGITSSNHLHHGYELLLPLSETSIEGLRGSSARGSTDATPQALYSTALSALLDMCEPSRASHADNPNTLQQIQSYPERPPQLPPPPPQHQQQQQQSATQPQELHILLQEIEERPSQLPQLQHQRQYSPELQGLLNQRERIQQQAKELLEQDRQLAFVLFRAI
ncbi:hypothetical protein BC939DRAFT_447434 [Gamsiella multidivaricata]|uniref:uncharacterized protein n=1 Tax=Gamsiella multidivaricata TaxID=101098 RepID=UPI00221F1A95|nr:uncharacterized protein BC939DRAFT_447434 [Gamsiella multidivaricata]KAI7825995.1 hypothetical protein BC939DRAFT_447434 [Gamsiella multidivaricata]